MYKQFFGFKERPFQLVPNPAYLFLSKTHEEALAHLSYAVSQGEGFVEITGEVGTGKTTLCRVFLENLDPDTEAAYIFNPKLDPIQLLKAINDEFGIDSSGDTAKDLIDVLNYFLIEKRAEGKRVIILIDEAQNLDREILEQLRLLSNLETTTSKLLQIILVGQPELGQMLDAHDLRQLAQRITLSCHLAPMTFAETRAYIQHRLQLASRKPGTRFTWAACYAIHQYAGGVPRLINIVCDRALLTAFGLGRRRITGGIANAAIRELAGRGDRRRYAPHAGRKPLAVLVVLAAVLAILIFRPPSQWTGSGQPVPTPAAPPASPAPADAEAPEDTAEAPPREDQIVTADEADATPVEPPPEAVEPVPAADDASLQPVRKLEDYLTQTDGRTSRFFALAAAVTLWEAIPRMSESLGDVENPEAFFRLGAKQNGLSLYRIEGDMGLIRRLDLPTILEMYASVGPSPAYVTLSGITDGRMIFTAGDGGPPIEAEPHEVESYWTGLAFVPWRNFFNFTGTIPREASEETIVSLKMLLGEIGYPDIGISPEYTNATRRAVEEIQAANGVRVDGLVGPVTTMILYNQLDRLDIPHLTDPAMAGLMSPAESSP